MFGDKLHKLSELFSHNQIHDSYLRSLSTINDSKNLFREDYGGDTEICSISGTRLEIFNPSEKMMLIDTIKYMPDDILCKVDRASMYHSLETRVPFLDHRIFEFAWSLNIDYKLNSSSGKRILKNILNNYVPRKLFDRPKMGFWHSGRVLDKRFNVFFGHMNFLSQYLIIRMNFQLNLLS